MGKEATLEEECGRSHQGTGSPQIFFNNETPAGVNKTRLATGYPRLKVEWPPGGAVTRDEGLSVITFPQFWLCLLAKALDESAASTPPPLAGANPGGNPPLALPPALLPVAMALRSPKFPPNPLNPCFLLVCEQEEYMVGELDSE